MGFWKAALKVAISAAVLAALMILGGNLCFNEDGNCNGMTTHAEYLDNAKVPNWRSRCGGIGRRTLKEVTARIVPYGGEVLEIVTCDTVLAKVRGRCYVVTQGFRSHSWTPADCPEKE